MSQQPTLIATPRARTTFLLLAAAALALSACTGPAGAEPSSSPAPVASASASQSPDATATYKQASEDGPAENVPIPEMPKEASLKSQQGLEAFIPYWFETVSYAYETGDLEKIKSITSPDCALCNAVFEDISSWTVEERWIVGGKLQVTKIEDRYVQTTSGGYAPYIFFSQEPLSYYSNGSLEGESDGIAEPTLWIPEVHYRAGAWHMVDLARPEGAKE